MRKNVIRINEGTLLKIIKESVKRVLKESVDPKAVIGKYNEVVAMGEGFDLNEIAEGLAKAYEEQVSESSSENYAWLDFNITPDRNGVGTIEFTPDGRPDNYYGHKTKTFEEAAMEIRRVLTTCCSPKPMQDHVIGWIITRSKYRPGIFPLLDEEGTMMYLEAQNRLSQDINRFYSGSRYTGD